jgi:DUF4097 and DUF4098 domain-containing protein YvlB
MKDVKTTAGGRGRFAALALGGLIAAAGAGFAGVELVDHTSGEAHHVERRAFHDVQHLRVRSDSGDIRVVGTSSDVLEVEGRFSGSISTPEMSVRRAGGAVEVSADCGAFFFDCNAEFEVRLPAGTAIDAETSSGDVEAEGLAAACTATLRTSSGDVGVRGSTCERITLRSSSGDINAEQVAATDIVARTSSGDLDVTTTTSPRRVEARTSSGDVTVVVPHDPAVAYDVDADTSSGDREVDVRTDPLSQRPIRAFTSSGDVSVGYASEP